eukprot:747341-Hanusia_phi.AAC.5
MLQVVTVKLSDSVDKFDQQGDVEEEVARRAEKLMSLLNMEMSYDEGGGKQVCPGASSDVQAGGERDSSLKRFLRLRKLRAS